MEKWGILVPRESGYQIYPRDTLGQHPIVGYSIEHANVRRQCEKVEVLRYEYISD